MTQTWDRYLRNREVLRGLQSSLPPLKSINIKSVNLDRRGPTVNLRLDMPILSGSSLPDWADAEKNRLQCHLKFLAVDDFALSAWAPGESIDVDLSPMPMHRMQVTVTGGSTRIGFSSSDALTIKHVSVYHSSLGEGDGVAHQFSSALDRHRLGATLPPVDDRSFYA